MRLQVIYDAAVPLPERSSVEPTAEFLRFGIDTDRKPVGLTVAQLLAGRLLIQGSSGAGKTVALRQLIAAACNVLPIYIVDLEGEYRELNSPPFILRRSVQSDTAALARRHRHSLLLDFSELKRERQLIETATFLEGLVETPRELWRPALVILDEAQVLAPANSGGWAEAPAVRRRCLAAMVDLMFRGRKRGLASVIATLRISEISKSVVAETLNHLVGMTTLDIDVERAARVLGWSNQKAYGVLPKLEAGQFIASGPAFGTAKPIMIDRKVDQ